MSNAQDDLALAVASVEGLDPDDVVHWQTKVAYLRALLAERTWRPISEAPRDDDLVLVYSPRYGIDTAVWNGFGWFVEECLPDVQPTHWMPLPEAPK